MNKSNTDIKKSKKKPQNTDKNTVDLSRRRLAKAGLVALPVLSTLPGKPAMATYAKNNCTVSGNMSGNMSHNVNDTDPCLDYLGGKRPYYWRNNPNQWKLCGAGLYLPTSLFHDIFDGVRQQKSDGTSFTLLEVINKTGNIDDFSLDMHAVTALLNAECFGPSYGYTSQEVIDLYYQHHIFNPKDLKKAFKYLNTLDKR